MAIEGQIEDLQLSSVLQLLALSGNSGRLTMTQPAGEGLIVLRNGRIIFAASSSARETLGNMLLCKGLITEDQLESALEIQQTSTAEKRLGAVLVDEGFVSQDVLEESVTRQMERVLRELLEWQHGFYRFDRFEVLDRGEIGIRAGDFLVGEGIATDKLLLGSMAEDLEDDDGEAEAPRSLRSVMREFRTPSFTGEVTAPVLGYARNLTHRGALFSASPRGFTGVGQYGFDTDESLGATRIRAIRLALDQPSVFRSAISRREAHVVEPDDNAPNREFLRQLGGGWPREALVAPLIVSGRVLMIFYGDNLPTDESIGSIEGFAQVLLHSALTMEQGLLEKRLEHAARLRRSSP